MPGIAHAVDSEDVTDRIAIPVQDQRRHRLFLFKLVHVARELPQLDLLKLTLLKRKALPFSQLILASAIVVTCSVAWERQREWRRRGVVMRHDSGPHQQEKTQHHLNHPCPCLTDRFFFQWIVVFGHEETVCRRI